MWHNYVCVFFPVLCTNPPFCVCLRVQQGSRRLFKYCTHLSGSTISLWKTTPYWRLSPLLPWGSNVHVCACFHVEHISLQRALSRNVEESNCWIFPFVQIRPLHQVSWKSIWWFLRNLANKQMDRGENRTSSLANVTTALCDHDSTVSCLSKCNLQFKEYDAFPNYNYSFF